MSDLDCTQTDQVEQIQQQIPELSDKCTTWKEGRVFQMKRLKQMLIHFIVSWDFHDRLNCRVIEVITFYDAEIALFVKQFRRWKNEPSI